MAKFQVGTGIDKYIGQLKQIEYTGRETIGEAIYAGAGIVADAVKANIRGIPKESCSTAEKKALIDGMGVAKMQEDNGYYNVKIGFDGYDNIRTKAFPRGRPIPMIARAIEAGTSFRPKHPFVAPAIRATKDQAEQTMAEKIDEGLKKAMG